MAMISFIGADGSGKTSRAEKVAKYFGVELKHFDKPKNYQDGRNQYFTFAKEMQQNPGKVYVTDRIHDGEWIYAPLYRGYKGDYLVEIESEFAFEPVLLVYVTASLEIIKERISIRGEDFVKEEHFAKVLELYENFMDENALPFIIINTDNGDIDGDVQRVLGAFEKLKKIWQVKQCPLNNTETCPTVARKPVVPRGNIEADIMIVGQNPGGWRIETSKDANQNSTTYQTGGTSKFLIETLKNASILRNCWLSNGVKCSTVGNVVTSKHITNCSKVLKEEIELINPKVVVALGGTAHTTIDMLGYINRPYRVARVAHPTWVKRFKGNDIDFLKKYTLDFQRVLK